MRGKGLQGLFQLGAGGHLGLPEAFAGNAATFEEAQRQADAAHAKGFGNQRVAPLAQDHLGGAAADVHHQARFVAGLHRGHAGIDQTGFLAAGYDFDGETQRLLRAQQEGIAIAGFAQRLRGHGPDVQGFEAGQPRRETPQAGQAALGGFFSQHAVGVEPGTQANGFLEVIDAAVTPHVALRQLAQFQPEAVGAHVDGRQGRAGAVAGRRRP